MTTMKMTLARADKSDFRDLWKLYKLSDQLRYPNDDLREQRLKACIAARVERMNGAFIRIGMGCEMLIRAVCTESDVYALKPEVTYSPEMLALLQELIDIEGRLPGTSEWGDKARALVAKATGEPT